MDFSQLDTAAGAEAGFAVQLRHPATDEPLGASITVHGQDSKLYRKLSSERARKWAKSMRRGKDDLSPEEARQAGVELIAGLTKSWEGIELDKKPLECTPENAVTFYTRFYWVVEQLDRAVHDRANFLPASSKK